MIVGDPAQELGRFGQRVLVERHIERRQLVGDLEHLRLHRGPIGDCQSHVVDRSDDTLAHALELVGIADAFDLEEHDRFGVPDTALLVGEGEHVPARIPLDAEDRMNDRMRLEAGLVDHHRRRVDEERHVVIDDRDDRVAAVESILRRERIEHADLRAALLALAHELEHVQRDACPLERIAAVDVVRRHMAEKCPANAWTSRWRDDPGCAVMCSRIDARRSVSAAALWLFITSTRVTSMGAEDTPHPWRNPLANAFDGETVLSEWKSTAGIVLQHVGPH